jgi:hypothetical protein
MRVSVRILVDVAQRKYVSHMVLNQARAEFC